MMASSNTASFEDFYQKLRASYLTRLNSSVAVIDNIIGQNQLTPLARETLEQAMQLAHGLAGSGTTFGFPEVTSQAQQIDIFLDRIIASLPSGSAMEPQDFQIFEPMMQGLRESCAAAAASSDQPAPKRAETHRKMSRDTFSVLIVDDDNQVPALLSQKLQQRNIRAYTASDGNAALALLTKQRPDLIILDIQMPGLSGHEVLRRLKQDPDYVSIPILMLTGKAQQEDVVSALHAGAIDYVVKPVDHDKLVARVEKILDASRFNVLIADNDPLILQLLESKFRYRGFKTRLAEDGKRALDMIITHLPDLVILDRMMPGMEGLAILTEIRNEEATKDIPVVILSARKNEKDFEEGLSRGAQAYIAKPFIPEDLITRCLKILHATDAAKVTAP